MLRTVVSTGAVPVTCVTPQAESQRVFAVSTAVFPAHAGGGKLLAAGVEDVGEVFVGVVRLAEVGLEASLEPQAANSAQRVVDASRAGSFAGRANLNVAFNRKLDKINPGTVVVQGFYLMPCGLDASLGCEEYVVKRIRSKKPVDLQILAILPLTLY